MPLQYVQDDSKRRIGVTDTDPFTLANLFAVLEL